MKKALALLLALTAFFSLAVTAVADGEDLDNIAPLTDGMTLGADAGGVTPEGLLKPGSEYFFPILIVENGEQIEVNDEYMNNFRFSYEKKEGSAEISALKVMEKDGEYVLNLKLKAGYPVKKTEVQAVVKMVEKSTGTEKFAVSLNFETGYNTIDPSALEAAKNGGYVQVTPDAPVITENNFNTLNEYANGGKVTFAGGDWKFSSKVLGQGALNLAHNETPVKEIMTKYQDSEFKFVNFPAAPTFDFTNGQLTVLIDDELAAFDGKINVYRYMGGVVYKLKTNFNEEDQSVTINTNKLGTFFISNAEIPNGTVINANAGGSGSGSGNNNGSANQSKPNPGMGAGRSAASAVVVMTAAVAAAAGVVVLKKSK